MANDDVLIVGKLDDKALLDSIDNLIKEVSDKSQVMANKFEKSMNIMKDAMKDFAITQKVSVDLMKESWREMSASFDAMFKAASEGSGGGKGSGKGRYDDGTLGQFREETKELERQREDLKLNSDELREQNRIIAERRRMLKDQTTDLATLRLDRSLRMPSGDLDEASRKLRMLEAIQRRYAGTTELSEQQQKKLADAIARCKRELDRFNSAKPKSLKDVLGMDESTLDAIAKKMRALRTVSIDPNNKQQVHDLGNEYARLSRLQAELMGKGIQLTHANNYLAQSFGYIRNRIVYALTLGAVTNFTKQIYEVRGQYELLERSLGILIDDMRRGSELFNELNAMALKSPFTLMELATGAKQLLAYNFAEEEVVDTTRRLADISSALGVPMERLVYNLGQIRAQTVLTARDARDFANAGLAIVPMLAQMYTEEKRFGDEIVTTAQVFDMMSKKMVSYADVMKVINKVTDEGGKFFDFQAKQAETLRVKMANLTLAWNNMLNEIGSENQSTLELPLKGLKVLFENWRALAKAVNLVVLAFGAYKAAAMLVALWNARLLIAGEIKAFIDLAKSVKTAGEAMALFNVYCKANPIGLVVSALAAAVGYFYLFNDAVSDAGGYTEKFGNAGAKALNDVESLFDTLKGISSESSNYKKVMGELNSILEEYDLETVKETDSMDVLNEKRRAAIALIKEESLERKHLNDIQQGNDQYESSIKNAREKMRAQLKEAMSPNAVGLLSENDDLRRNADAIANIISDVVERNVSLIAGKTGDEYEKGVNKIYDIIHERMRAIKLDEGTISNQWLDNSLFLHEDIVGSFVASMKEAKEARENYTTAIDNAYETEKKAIENSASFNERVEQTQTRLMKAANDTDNFAKKVEQLLKQYGGENIIDFLVKVRTEVPAWMNQKGLTELTQLSARFTALATNAKKAGKTALNVNGTEFSIEQLFQRAAQYTQAAQNKAADIEARKSSTITREASEALKQYKSALEAVNVAKNKFKRGTADQTLVTEKETEAQKAYNKALEKGVSLDELRKAKNGGKSGSVSKKDPLGDALKKEIQLISDIQKMYKDYQKAGVDADTARIASAKEYEKTLKTTNNTLSRYGIKGLTGEELATMDLRSLRDFYEKLRKAAEDKGNTKGVEALEKAIRSLNTEITKVDYKIITDGLNNELGRLKEEYELAVSLDADPELGSIFANYMGVNLEDLPKTAEEAAKKAQEYIDKILTENNSSEKIDISSLMDKKAFDSWVKSSGHNLEDNLVKAVSAFRDYLHKVNVDETKSQAQEWNKLLEKYAEYEYKVTHIQKEAEREREIARKKGASQDVFDAINNRERQEIARAGFEKFQKSPEWIASTGDLANMSKSAIGMLIEELERYKRTAKDLSPKEIKQLNNALSKLYKEQRKNNPFKAISNILDEARERMSIFDEEIEKTQKQIDELSKKHKTNLIDGIADDDTQKKLNEAKERLGKLKEERDNIGKIDASTWVSSINETISSVKSAIEVFDGLAKAIDSVENSDVDKVFSILDSAGKGASTGAAFGPYGAIIGGVVGAAAGVVNAFADVWSGNESINKSIEVSTQKVRTLEREYKRLEKAVDDAYGTDTIGAQRLMMLNKEAELAELERQLELEKSRKAKNKDQEKIDELRDKVDELRYEVNNAAREIILDLLEIGDAQDWANDFVKGMIDAFRDGENYMKSYEDAFREMVDNMIAKTIAGKVIGERIEQMLEFIRNTANARAEGDASVIAARNALDKLEKQRDVFYAFREGGEYVPEEVFDKINKEIADAQDRYAEVYAKAAVPTPEDIENVRDRVSSWKDDVKNEFDAYMEAFGVEFGSAKDSQQLSALQQGIQGITEDTAGSLEAYMNGVSQQVYLQSELITEIRDAVVGFNLDVQLDMMSQMLLQLQQSYQVQLAIQNIISGWSNPSGMAVRVEMI